MTAALSIAPRDARAPILKRCSCGRAYSLRAWLKLASIGDQTCGLDWRRCVCTTTIAVRLSRLREVAR
jgi:hypothetical protein